jgi:hypothetical protein
VGPGFFPLDERLELLPGGLTPFMHECLVRLGAWMPFQEAAHLLHDLLGVQVSKAQAVRTTEAAGAAYVAVQTEEANRILREAPEARTGCERLVFSADGAMVPLRGGEWGEVKTLAVGEVPPVADRKDAPEVRTQRLSYFSRLASAEQFEQLTLVELHRRGLEKSRQVAAVMDGADWLQSFVDYHRPDALRILDFPHAAQRIGQVGQVLLGEGTSESSQWIGERLHGLKHHGPAAILEELRSLQQQHPASEILVENLAYLEKREAQMHYPQFQAQGWPIGSGMVESGNKLVVEARLKGAGMHWERGNVNAMLGLRNIVCSDRWTEEWPLIANQLRAQVWERRKQLRHKRRLVKMPGTPKEIEVREEETIGEPPETKPQEQSQEPKSSGPKKPAANHPWRRSPIGRARYEPSKNARN